MHRREVPAAVNLQHRRCALVVCQLQPSSGPSPPASKTVESLPAQLLLAALPARVGNISATPGIACQ